MKDDPNHNEPTTAPLGAFLVFLVFAAVVLVFLSGCTGGAETTTTAPSQVAIPVQPPRPNVGMTVEQIQRVEEKVLRVEGAVDEVGRKIEEAQMAANSIEDAAQEAYENGLEAGSAAAGDLRRFTAELRGELETSSQARERASGALNEARIEVAAAKVANIRLIAQIDRTEAARATLEGRLGEANQKILKGVAIAGERDEARADLKAANEGLASAQKYKTGVWIAGLGLAAFVIGRFLVLTGRWTPQGRLAKLII